MKLFIKNFLKLILIFTSLILIQFFFFKEVLKKQVDFTIPKEKSVLILGDSQSETALNDSIIQNSINFSKAGDPLFFNYVKLKKIIENNDHIKTLLLGFSPGNLDSKGFYEIPKMKSKYMLYFYLIDYADHEDIIKHNYEGFIRGLTGLSKYFFKAKQIIKGSELEDMAVGGFRAIPSSESILQEEIENEVKIFESNPDDLSIKYFDKIVQLCNNHNIKLIIINTPVHESLSKRQLKRKKGYNDFFKKSHPNTTLWDFEYFKIDDMFYYDNNHLNSEGASIFSRYINQKLEISKEQPEH
jgi:hypothetical protein